MAIHLNGCFNYYWVYQFDFVQKRNFAWCCCKERVIFNFFNDYECNSSFTHGPSSYNKVPMMSN